MEPQDTLIIAADGTTPVPAPPWREVARQRSVLLTLAVSILLAGWVAFGLVALRTQIVRSELRMLAALAAAIGQQADGTLAVAETALRATADELANGAILPDSDDTQDVLNTRASSLPMFRELVVLDERGFEVATSEGQPDKSRSHASAPYFEAARKGSASVFRVGVTRSTGDAQSDFIPLSMPWYSLSGAFRGVVMLEAEPDFLVGAFRRSAPSPDTSIAIYRRDGALVSEGADADPSSLLDPDVSQSLWKSRNPQAPRIVRDAAGRTRLMAVYALDRTPLMVVITRDLSVVLADWRRQASLVGAFVTAALLVTLVLSLRNAREQQWRLAGEAALAAERERAVRAFRAAREGLWEWDPATRRMYLSPRMKELVGMQRDALVPAGESDLVAATAVHPDDVPALREAVLEHLAGRSSEFAATFRVREADAPGAETSWRHVRCRGQAWHDASGELRLFNGTAYDVSTEVAAAAQARQLDEQLQRSRRLEALGTLAGGVAHDFNNILAAVLGYGERSRASAPEGSPLARQLDHVLQAGRRGKSLVERILAFSGGGHRTRTPFRVEPVVVEVLDLLSASVPAGITIARQLRAVDAVVEGDSTALFEAVINLCTNGIQAMSDGGVLTVELDEVGVDEPLALWERTLAPGRYVCIGVTDTGTGIPPQAQPHLFEPFFTTKGPRGGTGLGLAVVHGVVTDLSGGIDVRTEPGQGTRFRLYLPLATSSALPDGPDDHVPRGNGQTVLLVDDEPALVEYLEDQLADLGYEPRGFVHAPAALAEFRARPDDFDLLVSDQAMPELQGLELARAVRALRPDLPVIIVSGYGGVEFAGRAAEAGIDLILRKPVTRAELARAADRVLKGLPGGSVSAETKPVSPEIDR